MGPTRSVVHAAAVFVAAGASLALASCSSGPGVYPIRELGAGDDSGLTVPLQRVFRSEEELRRFAGGIRSKGNFPSSVKGVDWTQEMVVVALGGDSEPGEHMSIVSTSELRGVLFVTVKKTRIDPSHPFVDEPAPRPRFS